MAYTPIDDPEFFPCWGAFPPGKGYAAFMRRLAVYRNGATGYWGPRWDYWCQHPARFACEANAIGFASRP